MVVKYTIFWNIRTLKVKKKIDIPITQMQTIIIRMTINYWKTKKKKKKKKQIKKKQYILRGLGLCRFSTCFKRETTSVTLWSLSCKSFVKRTILKGTNLFPKGSKLFPFRIYHFSEVTSKTLAQLFHLFLRISLKFEQRHFANYWCV